MLRSPAFETGTSATTLGAARRIVRWSGGPLELKKRELLGELPSDKSKIEKALLNWYSARSVELLTLARVDEAWLTWSAGLPAAEEKDQKRLVTEYIQQCRRAGVRPLALVSGSRLFVESSAAPSDSRVLKDADRKPIACDRVSNRAASLACYQANLAESAWRDQVTASSIEALEAGAAGIVLEGVGAPYEREAVAFFQEVQRRVSASNAKAQLIPLLSRETLAIFRSLPEFFIEDGLWPRVRPTAISFEEEEIVVAGASQGPWIDLNLWLMAYAKSASRQQPWHLAFQANRAAGVEPDTGLPQGSLALAVAEAASFGGSYVLSLDDALRIGLSERRAEAIQQWTQATAVHDFVVRQGPATSQKPVNTTAVVIDNIVESSEILNLLSRRGVAYSVILSHELEGAPLDPYAMVVAVNLRDLSQGAREHLLAFARSGGVVVTTSPIPPAGQNAEGTERIDEFANYTSYPAGKGTWIVYKEAVSDPNDFAREVRTFIPPEQRLVKLWNAPTVFARLTSTGNGQHCLQLLNYGLEPAEELQVQVRGSYRRVQAMSLESPQPLNLQVKTNDGFTEFTVPRLGIHGVVRLETN
jgi:hypothetical protein